MYGVIDFYKACISEDIKPIIGCEVCVAGIQADRGPRPETVIITLCFWLKTIGYQNMIGVSKGF